MIKKINWVRDKDKIISILLILPSIILVGVFIYGFIGNTIFISLTDWGRSASMAENPEINFIGLANYKELFTGIIQIRFRQDFINAIYYSIFLLVGTVVLGLLLAIFLDRELKGDSFFKTVFLYPMALSFIVTGTIWRWLLAPNGGFNVVPTFFGLNKIKFLWTSSRESIFNFNWQNIIQIFFFLVAISIFILLLLNLRKKVKNKKKITIYLVILGFSLLYIFVFHKVLPPILPFEEPHGFNLATVGIIIASIWQYAGYTMALYLAGLRSLPVSIKESAKIDGANEFTYYWKIAIPNVRPITLSAIIILAHISLKMFDLIFAMAGADNANTGHPSINMYLTTFRANNFGVGAAIAVILFLLAATFIIPYLVHSYRSRS
ncbi:MAG: sugar ABC transporter permease [Spirochaetes bacterium]|nr:sugar ABC transporter permease [Spirochaetota bacterium]